MAGSTSRELELKRHFDDDTLLCCPIPDSKDSGAIHELYRLQGLKDLAQKSFLLSVMCLMYMGINIVCIIMNSMGDDWMDADNHDHTFHLLEFWATFVFSCVQVYSLVYSPRSLGAVYSKPLVLKGVMFFNVVATFISAVLVSVSLESFEAPSHQLEYSNEITMSFVDIVLLAVVGRRLQGQWFTVLATLAALVIACVQLAVYNVWDGPNGGEGEQMAHYFEFAFEIISALISFSFCMDNKFLCDSKIREALMSKQVPEEHPPVLDQPCPGSLSSQGRCDPLVA